MITWYNVMPVAHWFPSLTSLMTGAGLMSVAPVPKILRTIYQTNPLTSSPFFVIIHTMKYIVIRYHSSPVTFNTQLEAEEFAMNCGDFSNLLVEGA